MYSRSMGLQSGKRAQEPAVTTTERYMDCMLTGNAAFACGNLDPRILVQSPMGYFYGRPICKGWIAFECSVFSQFAEFIIVKDISSLDGMKVAKLEWSVGGLHFADVFHINQLMQFRGITRTMTRTYTCQEDKDVAEAVLLALTGPYFAPHCGPRKVAVNGSRIDNHALVLPILDYTYKNLSTCFDILKSHPQGAKPVEDSSVAMHFMAEALERRREQIRIRKQSQKANANGTNTNNEFGRSEDKIAIKARNREGDQKVLFVDKADLNRTHKTSKVEAMEDDEVLTLQSKRDIYICSGVRYANNSLSNPVDLIELPIVLKTTIINAFYFLTVVDLSSNALTTIPDLSEFPLVSLQLHGNKIANWAEADKLNKLTKLQTLSLFGNPIQHDCESVRSYKYQLLGLFYHEGTKELRKDKTSRRRNGPSDGRNYSMTTVAIADTITPEAGGGVGAGGGARVSILGVSQTPPLRPAPKRASSIASSYTSKADVGGGVGGGAAATNGYISLRSLDHSVISPKEVDVVRTFRATFDRKRDLAAGKKEVVKEVFNPYIKRAPMSIIPRYSPLFASAGDDEQGPDVST